MIKNCQIKLIIAKKYFLEFYKSMKIFPVKSYSNFHPTSFGTTKRTTYGANNIGQVIKDFYKKDYTYTSGKYDKIIVSNSTHFLRGDMPWLYIGEKLEELYPDSEHVNIHNFACSDGSETYSLAICLIEQLGKEGAKKYFPIYASDVDEYVISGAKRGKIKAKSDDIQRLKEVTNNQIWKYFDIESKGESYILRPKEILTKNVQFECKDFEEGLDEIEGENNLIMCRNFWGYLDEDKIIKCAKKLYQKLDGTSYAIIGNFDMSGGEVPVFLSELGIDSESDNWKEETILKKYEGRSCGNYENEESIREKIKYFHFKKR